jgi:hypothetical protein
LQLLCKRGPLLLSGTPNGMWSQAQEPEAIAARTLAIKLDAPLPVHTPTLGGGAHFFQDALGLESVRVPLHPNEVDLEELTARLHKLLAEKLEPRRGLEPRTCGLRNRRSTN